MSKPLIAVVGRPNVGKSTLFNRLVGERISIVENTPGVTRDRVYADCEWTGHAFTLIDTGGLELKSEDEMWTHIRAQVEIAVENADAILFVLDGKTGLSLDDTAIASFLRKNCSVPVIVAVNKLDNNEIDTLYDFYSLGFGTPIGISAEQSKGLGDLCDALVEAIPKVNPDEDADAIKIAIVGRPNTGKSSLTNKILGYDRVIVSPIAGTTRDAIDTHFQIGEDKYVLIDTAGMRRKGNISLDLERYSVMRSLLAVRRADVVIIMCDATEGLTEQDIKIAGYVHDEGKPSIICMNKWDAVEKNTYTINKFEDKLKENLKFMNYLQSFYISAKSGQRVNTILPACKKVLENAKRRITTGLLNEVLQEAISINEPPAANGRRIKIQYVTQVSIQPPTFVFKVNEPLELHFSYKRYLENALRNAFDFSGTPIKLIFRGTKDDD